MHCEAVSRDMRAQYELGHDHLAPYLNMPWMHIYCSLSRTLSSVTLKASLAKANQITGFRRYVWTRIQLNSSSSSHGHQWRSRGSIGHQPYRMTCKDVMAPFESVLANFVIFTVLSSGSSKGECKKPHNIRDAFCEAYNRTTNTIHAVISSDSKNGLRRQTS